MNYRYDNENDGSISSFDEIPAPGNAGPFDETVGAAPLYTTPVDSGEPVSEHYIPAPVRSEAELMKENTHETASHVENEQRSPADWREASYVEVPQSQEPVFTPGLGNVQFYAPPRKETARREPQVHDHPRTARRGGRFIRALCLVLVCAVISAAAGVGSAYYVVNNGIIKIPATQVILGAQMTPEATPVIDTGDSAPPKAVANTDDVLTGPEIYGMATQQVLGVSTEITTNGGGYNPFYSGGTSSIYGTGFIISEDGYILTNYHVIETAYQYGVAPQIILRDGASYSARIVGFEATNDVAVLKIEATGLTPVKIGSSDAVRVGETIYAVGNPNQLDYTITDGIVSALDREVQVDMGGSSIKMFQISAAVNSGNSGGPVYNERGEVIGIVSAKYMSSGTEGLGFAIPIDDAMDIASDLITVGYVTGKAQLGVTVQTMTEANADYYGTMPGAFVFTVVPRSCADIAGIRPGDIITKLDDTKITTFEELKAVLEDYKAGDTVSIEIYRDGELIVLAVTFDELRTTTNGSQNVDVPAAG